MPVPVMELDTDSPKYVASLTSELRMTFRCTINVSMRPFLSGTGLVSAGNGVPSSPTFGWSLVDTGDVVGS